MLAGDRAVFPSRWAQIVELAMGHASMRAAMLADGTALDVFNEMLTWEPGQ